MYPKAKCQAVIDEVAPLAIKKLGLSTHKITFRLINSSTKTGKKIMGDHRLAGSCFSTKRKKHCITLYFDNLHGKKDCKSTLIHELIHARFNIFYSFAKKSKYKSMFANEEHFVHDLENYIVTNF